jgi:Ni2+-binding GTPase involved in maturation of urease and hydrogenase
MSHIRFVMIGGFLGAGKTTTIARLARHYQDQGRRVAVVTNDQAADLVDSHTLRAQGFAVGEVAGACFCCHFGELVQVVDRLDASTRPDLVLAEPVGSCTDLVATVVRPLQRLYGGRFDIAPYGVLLKPSHGGRILRGDARAGFSPKAAYIFSKQLEEADFVAINRIDELPPEEVDALAALLAEQYPAIPLLRMSARTGQGFDALLEMLEQRGRFGRRLMDVDYDLYAEGEAELGWLNSSLWVSGQQQFELDPLLLDVLHRLHAALAVHQAETAHLKVIGLCEGAFGVANLVASTARPELSLPSRAVLPRAQLVVNARVAAAPELLERLVRESIEASCAARACRAEFQNTQSFRPGRPVPTHRLLEPLAG